MRSSESSDQGFSKLWIFSLSLMHFFKSVKLLVLIALIRFLVLQWWPVSKLGSSELPSFSISSYTMTVSGFQVPSLNFCGFTVFDGTVLVVVRWDWDVFFSSTSTICSFPSSTTFFLRAEADLTVSIWVSVTGRARFLPISVLKFYWSCDSTFFLLSDLSFFWIFYFDCDFCDASAYVFLTLFFGTTIFLAFCFDSSSSESAGSEFFSEDLSSSTRSLTVSTKQNYCHAKH